MVSRSDRKTFRQDLSQGAEQPASRSQHKSLEQGAIVIVSYDGGPAIESRRGPIPESPTIRQKVIEVVGD